MANPNPSPETRFQAGSTPNPGGKTKEHKRMEMEAAEMAAKIRHAMLSSMMEKLDDGAKADELLTSDALRLMKDSEDRAHGTPKATSEISGPDGGEIPVSIAIRFE
jgi:hypothetical protein